MPGTRDRFFDAINESLGALLSAVEETEGRGHKLSRTVLQEARKGEQEVVELARKWTDSPTNFFDNFEAVVDVQARAQRRALELTRDAVQGANGYRRELRRAMNRFVTADRRAAEAVIDSMRNVYTRFANQVRAESREVTRPVAARRARRRARTGRAEAAVVVAQAS